MKSKSHLALWMAAIQTLPNAGTVIDATKFVKLTQRLQRLLSKATSSVFASSAAGGGCASCGLSMDKRILWLWICHNVKT
ncbi:hypothetical protein G4B88_017402 [Cannabis sativa]|uniref:Uncharacterized protein n=1 Tax=Cannabis sativa TaxID=3483 RepID=A0A7J6I5G9_CANSA|nr:hypothetical protein G4B88_017402 [Cannabis sativa]